MESVREGIVFYLRPHPELIRADGVRAGLAWEDVVRIDGMVKLLLEMFGVPYVPIESLGMQERVRLVTRVLSLAGLEPTDARDDDFLPRPQVTHRPGNGGGAKREHSGSYTPS